MPEAPRGPVGTGPDTAGGGMLDAAGEGLPDDAAAGDGVPDDADAAGEGLPDRADAAGGVNAEGDADGTLAPQLVQALARHGWTVAVAESLTGGMVTASIVDVPGASRVLRGGVVAYATDLKDALLGVDATLLAERGAVDPRVAEQMAHGVRRRLAADVGLATTGVAGPGSQDGHPPGEVHVAVATPDGVRVESLRLGGDRADVRAGARRAVLTCAVNLLAPGIVKGEHPAPG